MKICWTKYSARFLLINLRVADVLNQVASVVGVYTKDIVLVFNGRELDRRKEMRQYNFRYGDKLECELNFLPPLDSDVATARENDHNSNNFLPASFSSVENIGLPPVATTTTTTTTTNDRRMLNRLAEISTATVPHLVDGSGTSSSDTDTNSNTNDPCHDVNETTWRATNQTWTGDPAFIECSGRGGDAGRSAGRRGTTTRTGAGGGGGDEGPRRGDDQNTGGGGTAGDAGGDAGAGGGEPNAGGVSGAGPNQMPAVCTAGIPLYRWRQVITF